MMRRVLTVISALVLATTAISAARAEEVPAPLKVAKAGDLGTILTGPSGMTLYIFANDKEPGKSACNGPCAEAWPPFRPRANDPAPNAPLTIITRGDGSKQYAYKGKPLYDWKSDEKPGDTTGHKFRNVWFVAQP